MIFRDGADVARLGELDQKLWVALACPTQGTEIDARTLELIDADHDGRIRPPELVAACEWMCLQLRDPDTLLQGGDAIAVAAIADDPQAGDGPRLADEARRILRLRGKADADTLTLADVTDRGELLAAMRFNGDGVVTPDTAEDDAPTRAVLERILRTHGAAQDRNGHAGVDRARAEAFFADVRLLHDWYAGGAEAHETAPAPPISAALPGLPLSPAGDAGLAPSDAALPAAPAAPEGADLLAAARAVEAVRAKVDDFFARCRLAHYDPRALPALNPSGADYRAIAARELGLQADRDVARLPLAPVAPARALPLGDGVNPAWAGALQALRRDAVRPLLGATTTSLSEADWLALRQRVAPWERWLAARPATPLGDIAADEVARLLAAEPAVLSLVEQDERVGPHNARLVDLERLLRYQRDLLRLLENFVSFKAFYRREGAIFQAGTLYLDGRSCDLTVRVADAARHAALAGLAKTCLAYCNCTRQGETLTIASAFTAGDVDFLFVGRNGVFYDRQGRDWDATITRLIENPTSVTQAFFSPYKKFVRMIEEQVAKRAAVGETLAQNSLGALATGLASADKGVAPPPQAPRRGRRRRRARRCGCPGASTSAPSPRSGWRWAASARCWWRSSASSSIWANGFRSRSSASCWRSRGRAC